ncbi:MAG TPA: hypothetical protein PKG84_10970 [Novosphingobium sp.]|nr:hypothetical protein [Novosphingobium sp.]
MFTRLAAFGALIAAASPALASAGTSVPDPTDFGLFALGVTGLILGHYAARRQPPKE